MRYECSIFPQLDAMLFHNYLPESIVCLEAESFEFIDLQPMPSLWKLGLEEVVWFIVVIQYVQSPRSIAILKDGSQRGNSKG